MYHGFEGGSYRWRARETVCRCSPAEWWLSDKNRVVLRMFFLRTSLLFK